MKLKKLSILALLALLALHAFCQENSLFGLTNQADRRIPVDLVLEENTALDISEPESTIN